MNKHDLHVPNANHTSYQKYMYHAGTKLHMYVHPSSVITLKSQTMI
jgi:hypothetical protein